MGVDADRGKERGKSRERDLGFLPRDFRASTRQLSETGISRILVTQAIRSNSSVSLLNAEEGRVAGIFTDVIRETGVARGEKTSATAIDFGSTVKKCRNSGEKGWFQPPTSRTFFVPKVATFSQFQVY